MTLRALPALLFGAIVLVAAPAGALLEDTVESTTSELDSTVDDPDDTVDDTTETVEDTTEPIEDSAEEALPSTGDSLSDDEDSDSTSSDDNSTDPDSSSSSDDGSDSGDNGSSDGSDSTSDDGDTNSSGDGSKLSPELQKALTGDSSKDATFDPTREDAVDTDGDGIPDAYASDVAASGGQPVDASAQNASGEPAPDTQFVEAPGVAWLAGLAAVGVGFLVAGRRR